MTFSTLWKKIELPSLWGASAVALANESYSSWFFQLRDIVERSPRLQKEENLTFWRRLSYSAFMTACDMPESEIGTMKQLIGDLILTYAETPAEHGLQKVMESISNHRAWSDDSMTVETV